MPPWAFWKPAEWKAHHPACREIIDNMLGWDVASFEPDFHKRGLLLFTLRNGNLRTDHKPYAEKIMIVEEAQETPMHFHWLKMEDIINRGGGNLVIELYQSNEDHSLREAPVTLKVDGILRTVPPGGKVVLRPGESICLEPGVYHRFYGEPGKGKVLVGEVSSVNDDKLDNCFYENLKRFPAIEEDVEPLHLLVTDYGAYL